jgi:hypothetical protein
LVGCEAARPPEEGSVRLLILCRRKFAGHGLDLGGGGQEAKVFWFFSSEKNILFPGFKILVRRVKRVLKPLD